MKKRVFIYEPLQKEALEQLEEQCEVVRSTAHDQATLIREVKGAEAVIIRALGRVTAEVMDAAGGLRVIARQGVGVDNIDLEAARARGIRVINSPRGNTLAVAEHFLLLALGLARQVRQLDIWLRSGNWQPVLDDYAATELSGRTLGILGFGNIGQTVARICSAGFNMPVLYASRRPHEEEAAALGAERVETEDLFRRSDFIAICQALTPDTQNLVKAELIGLMKPSAYLINLSRGGVWNEDDLASALRNRSIAGAASDVYQQEPLPENHPLLSCDNFFGTPHSSALTAEALRRIDLDVAGHVLEILNGRPPRHYLV